MKKAEVSHAALVKRASKWLEMRRCSVVICDGATTVSEMPDAIGWDSAITTILIECKASRADFLKDAKKPMRRYPELGMGRERWYLAPAGVIKASELPAGWGLLEATGSQIYRRVPAKPFKRRNETAELRLLHTMAGQWRRALADLHRAWRRLGR